MFLCKMSYISISHLDKISELQYNVLLNNILKILSKYLQRIAHHLTTIVTIIKTVHIRYGQYLGTV
jgi:hypothetical protein